jgi:hypothetical protein
MTQARTCSNEGFCMLHEQLTTRYRRCGILKEEWRFLMHELDRFGGSRAWMKSWRIPLYVTTLKPLPEGERLPSLFLWEIAPLRRLLHATCCCFRLSFVSHPPCKAATWARVPKSHSFLHTILFFASLDPFFVWFLLPYIDHWRLVRFVPAVWI